MAARRLPACYRRGRAGPGSHSQITRRPAAARGATSVFVALIALIGISRILLGVRYLSDVVGAWAVGITWLGVTTFAFELARSAAGQPATALNLVFVLAAWLCSFGLPRTLAAERVAENT